jgi:tRNA dimethylallyltransferase
VDLMMEMGLLGEVKELVPYKHLNALQTVGYAELFEHLAGNISLEKAVDQIKTSTRQYAKRQMTWFRRDKEIHWFAPVDLRSIIRFVEDSSSEL